MNISIVCGLPMYFYTVIGNWDINDIIGDNNIIGLGSAVVWNFFSGGGDNLFFC